jgi:ABC-type dipeptide/oligopeptide/nickel transport system permease component
MLLKLILKRLVLTVIVMVGVSIIAFVLVRLAPGDPARLMLGNEATDEAVAELHAKLGLDEPWIVQYGTYMNGVFHGDLGRSYYFKKPNIDLIRDRLPNTAALTAYGMILIIGVGLPLGLIAGIKKGSAIDVFSMFLALIGQAMSPVWLCLLLILVFGVGLRMLPTQGMGSFAHIIMPSICIAFGFIALVTRMLRSGMIDVLHEDYITATRARGIGKFKVYTKYAFKNALLPIITVMGNNIGVMMAGSMVIESIFNWPGLGHLTVVAINNRDFALVQSILLISAFIFVMCNLIVDILYTFVDRRITFG